MSGEPLGSTCCARAAEPRAAEVDVAVHALNRMMGLGRPNCVRTARPQTGLGLLPPLFRSMQHLWTPPSGQGKTSGWSWHVVGCCHLSGLWCSGGPPRACMGVRGPGPNHARVLEVTVLQPGCPDPVSPTVAPCLPSARPTPSRPRPAYAVTAGARYTPPLTSKAQTTRAVLLARATVTSIFGLRASVPASHEPAGAPR